MKKPLFLLLFAFPAFLSAQNLVVNPGFDEFDEINWSVSTLEFCTGWTNPTLASPDYFNSSLSHNPHMVDPKTWWGYQTPKSGTAYTGIIAYWPEDKKPYSEYLQAHFTQPLIAGQMYEVSLNISLAECATLSLISLGAYVSDKQIFMKTVAMLKYKPQLVFPVHQCDTASWTKLSLTYQAKGGEQYMVIGLFSYDQYIKLKNITPSPVIDARQQAYYFIEDVSVIPLNPGLHSPPRDSTVAAVMPEAEKQTAIPFDLQKPFVLEHILFESGSDVLVPSSFAELDALVLWLNKTPNLKAKVNGYTDADGPEAQNLKLSQKRAEAVSIYLVKNGIDRKRLKPQGFGEMDPRDTNDTATGKARNRRVEIKTF